MRHGKKRGFTLIELLVVIAIIGVLTTVAVVALGAARRKSRDAKRIADVKAMQNALELYFLDANSYPQVDPAAELGAGDMSALCTGGFKATCGSTDVVYMESIPQAPTPVDNAALCGTGDLDKYMYVSASDDIYDIDFCLGEAFGDFAAGPVNANEEGMSN